MRRRAAEDGHTATLLTTGTGNWPRFSVISSDIHSRTYRFNQQFVLTVHAAAL